MSNTVQFVLGAIWVVVFIGVFIGLGILLLTKVAPRFNAWQRRQKIRAAMQMGMFDRDAIDEIADEIGREGR